MPGSGTEMAGGGIIDRMWVRITRTLIDTGRPPHYAELARSLGVSPAESRSILHAVLQAYPTGGLHPGAGLHRLVPAPERPAHPVPGDGARGAEVVRSVRVRGNVGDLALSRRACADRRRLSRLRRPADRRDARRAPPVGRSP